MIGAATALFAGTIGLVQNDIKRVLAYSTVSQLGYMFLAMGVGAFGAGIFHLYTHAFFKALLFLGSGAVIHALHGEQDIRNMGGLKKHLPVTYWTFLIGSLAIAGVPFLAGFFSKDEILFETFAARPPAAVGRSASLTSLLTATYMFRLVHLTFHGEERFRVHGCIRCTRCTAHRHVHPAHAHPLHMAHAHRRMACTCTMRPRPMAIALVVLALGSVLAGYIGMPHGARRPQRARRLARAGVPGDQLRRAGHAPAQLARHGDARTALPGEERGRRTASTPASRLRPDGRARR